MKAAGIPYGTVSGWPHLRESWVVYLDALGTKEAAATITDDEATDVAAGSPERSCATGVTRAATMRGIPDLGAAANPSRRPVSATRARRARARLPARPGDIDAR